MFLKDPLIVRFWPLIPLLEGWVGSGRWIVEVEGQRRGMTKMGWVDFVWMAFAGWILPEV